jgi:hypothetical protein
MVRIVDGAIVRDDKDRFATPRRSSTATTTPVKIHFSRDRR